MENSRQTRSIKTTLKVRSSDETADSKIIEGYFAVYESETCLYDNVYEVISKGAFDGCIGKDIRALWNHNTKYVLGRTVAGTLELRLDDKGLYGKILMPNTSYANDLYELIKRGDVNQCSFGFEIIDEVQEKLQNGSCRWRINEVELYEISVVTFPAYEDTAVEARKKQMEGINKRAVQIKKAKLKQRLEDMKAC